MIHSTMGGMHMIAALMAVALGLIVLFLPKGRAPHRLLGLAYTLAMLITCISALLLYGLTGHFGLFHAFALLCLSYVLIGICEAILRRHNWMRRHIIWMGWSYIGLLAAAATEASIRLPMLNHLTSGQTFLLGGVFGMVALIAGLGMLPRWTRLALMAYREGPKAPAAP